MSEIKPTAITFSGPEGSTIVIDEDGPSLRINGTFFMEWSSLQRLVQIITAAGDAWQAGQVPTPVPSEQQAGILAARAYMDRKVAV